MIEYQFHSDAMGELKDQIRYYEEVRRGLGADFAEEVFRAIERLRMFPEVGSPEDGGIRRLSTKRFPFIIYYEVINGGLYIWAVLHAALKPGAWKKRRNKKK